MHIHIPDGVLPIWLWIIGYLITAFFLLIVLPRLKKDVKKIPLAAAMTAIALLAMSLPLGLPAHLNLMALIGLLIGPSWSLIIALIINLILASFAHGGLTIIGLNTIILWFQALAGIFLFRLFIKSAKSYFLSACLSTFISLILAFLLIVGIVMASTIEPAEFLDLHEAGGLEMGHTEISLLIFVLLSLPVVAIGGVIESLITGFMIKFIQKVKPELISKP